LSKISITLEGDTWAEVVKQAASFATLGALIPGAPAPSAAWEAGHLATAPKQPAPPQPLPFDKNAALIPPPPEYVCPEHGARLNHKPAGVNRAGTPYSEGWRCPVSGCRTFVPMAGVA
jgi:hypothetical protein